MQYIIHGCTWDWELRDRANKLALGEGRSVVILIQDHYLYGGRILQSLSTGGQRKGFQLHTHIQTNKHTNSYNRDMILNKISIYEVVASYS